jgi:hypothetical protein
MGELEGIGEAVTGTLAAAALEPATGTAERVGGGNCLNCGASLAGAAYCASCGQKARIHHSLSSFLHDFVQGMFNFEGKIWRTLPMLAWRPGQLTRRYIDGQRASFISPVALYLFTVFLMFAVLNFTGALGTPESFREALRSEMAETQAQVARLETEREAALAAGKDIAEIDVRIARRKEDIAENQKVLSGEALTAEEMGEDVPEWLRPLVKRASENPDLLVADIQDAASKYSWLLIPLSVPFLWLLFPFSRRFRLYDHTVFVTYSLSFMMMLAVLAGLLVAAGAGGLASFLLFMPPIHMYRQLMGAYGLSRWSALWRTVLLVSFSFVVSGLFFTAALAIGIL